MRSGNFTVSVPGGQLTGICAGAGDSLLVLHGGPGLSDYTGWFSAELASWTSLRYTQRGLAPSTTSGPFTVQQHVEDAIAVLDQHRVGSAVVLGHSWGGYLAMQLAAAAPHRVAGLVLIDTLGAIDDGGFAPFAAELAARSGPEVMAEVAELDELAERRPGSPEATAAELTSLRLIWPAYFADPAAAPPMPADLSLSRECYAGTFESIGTAQADDRLARRLEGYPGPVEIVTGSASPFPLATARATAALFAQGRVTIVAGAGHFPWYEHPGCVAAALDRIAGRDEASAAASVS